MNKRVPYSNDYTINGSFAYYLFDNMTGIASFLPEAGKRVISHLTKIAPSVIAHESFRRATITQAAVVKYFKDAEIPSFLSAWPNLTIDSNEDGEFHVSLNENEQNVETLYFIATCKSNKCIKKCPQCCDEIQYINNRTFELRLKPVRADIDITVRKGTKIEIIMCFDEKAEELKMFKALFPSYVTHFAKNRHIPDTCLVNSTSF